MDLHDKAVIVGGAVGAVGSFLGATTPHNLLLATGAGVVGAGIATYAFAPSYNPYVLGVGGALVGGALLMISLRGLANNYSFYPRGVN